MKDFIEYLVKNIVDNPDKVKVIESSAEKYQLIVDPDDIGKVIGKNGIMINFIRTLINSVNGIGKTKIFLEIIE